jgi:hypothetical protein
MQKIIVLTVMFLFSCNLVFPNQSTIRFRKLTTKEGLPRKNCLAVEQDSVGFLEEMHFHCTIGKGITL